MHVTTITGQEIDADLAPYLAREQAWEEARLAQNKPVGVCWSGMQGDPAKPRSFDEILAAAIEKKRQAEAFAASPKGRLRAALNELEQIGFAPEANKLRGIYERSIALEKVIDPAAIGAVLVILEKCPLLTARDARLALAELLMPVRKEAA